MPSTSIGPQGLHPTWHPAGPTHTVAGDTHTVTGDTGDTANERHRIMRTTVKRLLITTAAAVAASSVAAIPSAGAGWDQPCETRVMTQAFKQWGDLNNYFLVTGGTFEDNLLSKWDIKSGATVVSGEQSPWKVNGRRHTRGMRIPAGASVETLDICVMVDEESMRFFYRSPGVRGAQLRVDIEADSDVGKALGSWTADGARAGWQVSPPIAIPNVRGEDGRQEIDITFTPIGTRATWAIDDVMIDPWRTR